jgi:cell division protein FtsN
LLYTIPYRKLLLVIEYRILAQSAEKMVERIFLFTFTEIWKRAMPFDDEEEEQIENEPSQEEPQPRRPGPILHTPKTGLDIPFKIVIPIILLLLVGAGGYWYYTTKMVKRVPRTVVNMPVDTNQMQQQPAVQTPDTSMVKEQTAVTEPAKEKPSTEVIAPAKKSKAKIKENVAKSEPTIRAAEEPKVKVSSSTSGKYSIVIGSFKSKQNADDLYALWKKGGYPANLTTKGTWYKVSIGKYPSIEEARKEALKMQDSFKNGYVIEAIE